METIDINEFDVIDSIGHGSYGDIYKVKLENKEYAFKHFYPNYTLVDDDFVEKISSMDKFVLNNSYIPIINVNKSNKFCGYLTKVSNSKNLSMLIESNDINRKVALLKTAKNNMKEIHENGIVHADIHEGNILLNESKLIDFDNCHFDNFYTETIFFSNDACNYLREYDFDKDLDIYLFNLMTFRFLNGLSRNEGFFHLLNNNYGIFENKDAQKICKSLILENDLVNNDLLIDTIDMSNIKKLNKKL